MPETQAFGTWTLVSNLGAIVADLEREAKKRTFAAANVVRTEWLRILSGSRSGRIYRIPGTQYNRRGKQIRAKRPRGWVKGQEVEQGDAWRLGTGAGWYIASAPGEAPARLFGDLARSVRAISVDTPTGPEGWVGSDMDKAPWLEFGTGRAGAAAGQTDLPEGYVHGGSPGMAPRPSLRPALDRTRPKVQAILSSPMFGV